MEGIYLIGNKEFGWYKIGMAKDVESRTKDIANGVPFSTELVAAWPCQRKWLRILENRLHKMFAPSRVRGEWYRFSSADVARVHAAIQEWRKDNKLAALPEKEEVAVVFDTDNMFGQDGIMNLKEEPFKSGDKSLTFRFAEAGDSERFSQWATNNSLISPNDFIASLKKNNPTSVTLVIEKDGEPVLFAPFWCQMNLGYLGFNPEASMRVRILALQALRTASAAFAQLHGIREITVHTSENYPVAQWALHNGFKAEGRKTLTLRLSDGEKGLAAVA